MEANRAHSREKLAALLWPDVPDQSARNNLRHALSKLRKALGDLQAAHPFLCVSGQTVQLDLEADIDVDVITFSRLLSQPPLTQSALEEIVSLYRGDFLEGFSIDDSTAFENGSC
jgi:DNA-binding SARP family transcriptional activator